MERWRLGFLVPLAAALATGIFIVIIGELLLATGDRVVIGSGDATVRLAAVVAMLISVAILAISAFVARGGASSRE